MKFETVNAIEQRKNANILILPFWKEKKNTEPAADFHQLNKIFKEPLQLQDFSGKEGEILFLYAPDQIEKRIALLGLGAKEGFTIEKLRRAYSQLVKALRPKKFKEVNLVVPVLQSLSKLAIARGIAEGLLLANYIFNDLKHDALKEASEGLLERACLIGLDKNGFAEANKCKTIAEAVYFSRNLVNGNADDVTPQRLIAEAKDLAKAFKTVKTHVLDKKQIEKEKMGLLLAVSRASPRDPAVIILEYKGNPKSKDHTVLVGKGITFDTGGLNIKPTGSMETMRCDMAGAAAVLGSIKALASLGIKVNVTGVIPTTENAIGSKSYKPGDVYQSYSGKTVEIGNTDAEGRLILADALAYAVKKLKPTRMIDLATLTGAVEVALGNETTGLMSNNDALADSLIHAGSETFERVWRLPLYDEYQDQLKSEIADIKSTGGRGAGCITAAMFLQEFVGKTPWAHLDIAGTAFITESKRYHPKNATGIGVRLLLEFLEHI